MDLKGIGWGGVIFVSPFLWDLWMDVYKFIKVLVYLKPMRIWFAPVEFQMPSRFCNSTFPNWGAMVLPLPWLIQGHIVSQPWLSSSDKAPFVLSHESSLSEKKKVTDTGLQTFTLHHNPLDWTQLHFVSCRSHLMGHYKMSCIHRKPPDSGQGY